MIDNHMNEFELALEVGCRVVQTGPDNYQFQKIDSRGKTRQVAPTQRHAYELWVHFVRVAQQLAAAIEGGEAGGGVQPDKSEPPQVA